jgi:Heavy metal associated domain 2
MFSNTDLSGAAVAAPILVDGRARPPVLEIDVVHHVPGRLRLRSARLKGNARAGEEAQLHLAQLTGVTSAKANACTGSLLVEYDPAVIPPGRVIDVLGTHGYISAAAEAETQSGPALTDQLATSVRDGVINVLAERLAVAMIGAVTERIVGRCWL